MELLDCGDHSCRFANDQSGMRTNGGCRCLRDVPEALRHRIHATFQALQSERDDMKNLLQRAVSVKYCDQLQAIENYLGQGK